jgi:hypothetical protein
MFSEALRGKTVAVLGLTFKPNTDDMREAPSLDLIIALQDMGAKVRAFDPVGMRQARALLSNVAYCTDAYDCAEGADALVIVTEWEQFRALDLERLRELMARPVLVDLRSIYRPEDMNRLGFAYAGVGRPMTGFWESQLLNQLTSAKTRVNSPSEETAVWPPAAVKEPFDPLTVPGALAPSPQLIDGLKSL